MNSQRPQMIPAALAKEIQAALAAGRPLPPGVVAVPSGQAPPPGAVPTGMVAQMAGGQPPQQTPTKQQHNPLPDGDEGLKILRGFANCPIPGESNKLNKMLQMVLQTHGTEDEAVDDVLARGLTAAMKANRYCSQNKKTRTVCIFAEDEKLADLHQKLKTESDNLDRLNKEMEECVKRGNTLLQERWQKAVDTYGLSPEKYFYHIDEEKGIVEQVDLACDSCKGVTIIKKARQDVTDILMKPKTVPTNTPAPEPAAEEAPTPKVETPVVSETPATEAAKEETPNGD